MYKSKLKQTKGNGKGMKQSLPSSRGYRGGRVLRASGSVAALGGLALALRWSMGSPTAIARSLAAATQPFDTLLIDAIALIAWAVVAWAAVVVTIELATALPGVFGRQFTRLARIVTPATVRRLAQAAIGFSVLVGPMTAGRAMAADAGSPSPATSTAVVAAPAPSAQPLVPRVPLDRPFAQGPVAIDLDRPARPTTPEPPAPARTVSPSTATLAAGAPRREATTLTYVVRRGDALWDVAARHLGPTASAADIAREWPRWYAANRGVIGPDPDLIHPGDVLVPPSV